MLDPALIPALLEPQAQEEIGKIEYLLSELASLSDRKLVSPEVVEAVRTEKQGRLDQITRLGRFAESLQRCNRLAASAPDKALVWAEAARLLAPERKAGWDQVVALLQRLGQHPRAIELVDEAKLEFGHIVRLQPIPAPKLSPVIVTQDDSHGATREGARFCSSKGDYLGAAAIYKNLLAINPDDNEMLVSAAWAFDQANQLGESRDCCERLSRLRPSEGKWWSSKVAELDRRIEKANLLPAPTSSEAVFQISEPPPVLQLVAPKLEASVPLVPKVSWPKVAGEFVEVHWQKLLLGLAVPLIIVSSTAVAANMLGDQLWRPEGKCLLALGYTLAFAFFGRGVVRWGADRAGRIMLLTTLFIVPVNFTLAGELPTLAERSPLAFAVLGIVAFVLMGLCWRLCAVLKTSGGNVTPVALIALGLMTAMTPRGASFSWGFTGFIGTAVIFAVAVSRLNLRLRRREEEEEDPSGPYFALGLLGFTYAWSIIRIGVFVLEIGWSDATLYALPVMLGALACFWSADGIKEIAASARSAALLKYGGFVLSALGFALALAKPSTYQALYSGNTLITALVGLGIYGRTLRLERKPVYLYVSFAALFVAYFGAYDFVRDLMSNVEAAASTALGYSGKLPPSFRALNGLVFNVILAGMAWFMTERWNDPKLARHCHYIGLPLSILACAFSCLEPTAALLTLPGYTVLYGLAIWRYKAPWIGYFACATFTGSAVAGSTFLGDLTFGAQALAASSIALGLWLACPWLEWRGISEEYRTPLLRSARVVSFCGLLLALLAAVQPGSPNWTTTLAFASLAILYVLIGIESPRVSLAHAATGCGSLSMLLAIGLMTPSLGLKVSPAWLGFWASLVSVILTLTAVPLARRTNPRLVVYPPAFRHLGLSLAGLGMLLGTIQSIDAGLLFTGWDLAETILAFAMAAIAFALAHHERPSHVGVVFAMLSGMIATILGVAFVMGGIPKVEPYIGSIALSYVLSLIVLAKARSSEELYWHLFQRMLFGFSLVVVFWGLLGIPATIDLHKGGLPLTLLSFVACLVVGGLTGLHQLPGLWHVMLGLAASTVASFAVWNLDSTSGNYDHIIALRIAWIGLAAALSSFILAVVRGLAIRRSWTMYYALPLLSMSLITGLVAFVISIGFATGLPTNFAPKFGSLILIAAGLLTLAGIEGWVILSYAGLANLVIAAYVILFEIGRNRSGHISALGVLATGLSVGFWSAGYSAHRFLREKWQRPYTRPLNIASLVMGGLAVAPCLEAPKALAFAAIPFLLMIKTFPAAEWLYVVFALFALATWGQLEPWLTPAARGPIFLGIAFVFYLIGMLTSRVKALICQRLGLIEKTYEQPIFVSALVAGVVTLLFRLTDITQNGQAWYEMPWMYLGMGVFSLVMLNLYSTREWIDGFVIFVSLGLAALAGRWITFIEPSLLVVSILALGWVVAGRWTKLFEGSLLNRLALPMVPLGEIFLQWSTAMGRLCIGVTGLWVFVVSFDAVYDIGLVKPIDPSMTWWSILVAIGILSLHTETAIWFGKRRIVGSQWPLLAVLLWLAGTGSPAASLVAPTLYIPLVTVLVAVVTALANFWFMSERDHVIPALGLRFTTEEARARGSASLLDVVTLVSLAVLFTRLTISPFTILTFVLSAFATGLIALGHRRGDIAQIAALLWSAACVYTTLEQGGQFITLGFIHQEQLSVGLAAAALSLMLLCEWLRRSQKEVVLGLESVALVGSCLSVLSVFSGRLMNQPWAGVGVGVLLVAAVTWTIIANHRQSLVLAYAGQFLLLAAYATYRSSYELGVASDATVMLFFGVVELGLAEVLERLGRPLFARPALTAALVLPALGMALSLRAGLESDRNLFITFAVATLYAMLGFRQASKWLWYAAAIVYNAFLWFLWSRFGWELAKNPQFYVVPVGLSAILFAEGNRKQLGKTTVNAIRGVGMMLIYLALAVPIWQFDSLAAWAFALFISMAAIFAGIGLKAPTFLWLGLAGFGLTVIFQLGQLSYDYPVAKWAIMLGLAVFLFLFVAFNEKKGISLSMRKYLDRVREWD